jgi:hypothetical protein
MNQLARARDQSLTEQEKPVQWEARMSLENLIVKLVVLVLVLGVLACRAPRILAARLGRTAAQ